MADARAVERACDALEQRTDPDRLEARGSVRRVLSSAAPVRPRAGSSADFGAP